MAISKYKLFIFDLGNVTVDFNHWIAVRRITKFGNRSTRQIYNLVFDSGLTERFEEGELSGYRFFCKLKKCLGLDIGYREFLPIWNEIFFISQKNRQIHQIIKLLKPKYKILLLSNINKLHFEYLREKFPKVFKIFPRIILSYRAGFRKPHPSIYKKALRTFRVDASQAIYIDDRADLVRKASGLGIKSLQFRTVRGLKKDLASLGIRV